MKKFVEALEKELTEARNINSWATSISPENELVIYERIPESKLTKQYHFRVWDKLPHHFAIDIIWVGKDSEGSPWSDHMGGCTVDCTGMNRAEAIKAICDKAEGCFPEMFNA